MLNHPYRTRQQLARVYKEKTWKRWQMDATRAVLLHAKPLYDRGYNVAHWQPRVADVKGPTINVSPGFAWKFRYIQLMPTHVFNAVFVDIDRPNAESTLRRRCEHGYLQWPHYLLTNPKTKHVQAGWFLSSPVHRDNDHRRGAVSHAALALFRCVRLATWRVLGADMALHHDGILRNPMHPDHVTHLSERLEPYMLSELITPTIKEYIANDRIIADQVEFSGMPKRIHRYNPDGTPRKVSKAESDKARRAQAIGVANTRARNRERDQRMLRRRSEGATLKEIADEVGLAISTVRNTLHRRDLRAGKSKGYTDTSRRPHPKTTQRRLDRDIERDRRHERKVAVLVMREKHGLSFSAIAQRLGMSKSGVFGIYDRAWPDTWQTIPSRRGSPYNVEGERIRVNSDRA